MQNEIEEINKKCLRISGGKVDDDFLGLVFGSVMDYGSEQGGLMSLKAFGKFLQILNKNYTPNTKLQQSNEEYLKEFKEWYFAQNYEDGDTILDLRIAQFKSKKEGK